MFVACSRSEINLFECSSLNKQKIFGLERVNFTKQVKIVEGPIDSLFISNCVAAAGADLLLKNKNS